MHKSILKHQLFYLNNLVEVYLDRFDARLSLNNSGMSILSVMQNGLFVLLQHVGHCQRLGRVDEAVVVVVQKHLSVADVAGRDDFVVGVRQHVVRVVSLRRYAVAL